MMSPTPVSHNFYDFMVYILTTNLPLPTDKIEKPKFTFTTMKIKRQKKKSGRFPYWILELEMGIEPTTY